MESLENVVETLKKHSKEIEMNREFGDILTKTYVFLYRQLHTDMKPSGKGRVSREIYKKITPQGIRSYSFIDHSQYDGEKLIFEPYDLSLRDMKALIQICEENDLDFTISGRSLHYPGETLRITVYKRNNE